MPDPPQTTALLLGTAASLAIVHTLLGIDHSLPFVALGRARGWALGRTLLVTASCGAGHVASSVLIGAAGVAFGVATDALLWLESTRGELAAALLIGFGLAYAARAVWRSLRGRQGARLREGPTGAGREMPAPVPGAVPEVAAGGERTGSDRRRLDEADARPARVAAGGERAGSDRPGGRSAGRRAHRVAACGERAGAGRMTPWALFIVFVLGPCEPLIPLMVVPGMARDWLAVAAVVAVFGLLTVAAMLLAVAAAWRGAALFGAGWIGRHADAAAGLVVAASGAAVLFLGL